MKKVFKIILRVLLIIVFILFFVCILKNFNIEKKQKKPEDQIKIKKNDFYSLSTIYTSDEPVINPRKRSSN